MADIQLQGIRKAYGETLILDSLDLTIRSGEFLTLLGPSGCGKSTLLKLLAGLELPDAGGISRGNHDLLTKSPSERDIAMVFQSYALYPHMTVGDNVCTPLHMRGLRAWQRLPGARWVSTDVRRKISEAQLQGRQVAKALGIESLWSRKPAQLSGGQRQRVALARAMVRRPAVFLFDEPLSNLDVSLRQALRAEIRQLHDELGVTFVYVTHDQHEAMSMSDRVAVMSRGRILQLATPQEIYDRPAHREVANFVGAPRINLLDLSKAGDAMLSSDWSLQELTQAGIAEIGFRPHTASLQPLTNGLALRGVIRQVEFTGAELMLSLAVADATLITLVLPASEKMALGAVLTCHVPAAALRAFGKDGQAMPMPCVVQPRRLT